MNYPKCQYCDTVWTTCWEYCPQCRRNYGGAIYPELYSARELESVEKTSTIIRDAFRGVELGSGLTIHEADLEGHDYDGAGEAARAKDPERNWMEIPDWKLERIHVLSYAFDVEGWRFHLPAYLIWTLKNWRTSTSITSDFVVWGLRLRDNSEYDLERFHSLSIEQSKAVLAFLDHLDQFSGYFDARDTIESYWDRFQSKGQDNNPTEDRDD
jgi:hypothetical protein